MLEEIALHEIHRYAVHFPGPQLGMVLASIVEGNTDAQFWRCRQEDGGVTLLLWDKGNNVFYFAGSALSQKISDEMSTFLRTQIAETAHREGLWYFSIRSLLPASPEIIAPLFQGISLQRKQKRFYAYRKSDPPTVPADAPEHVCIARIDAEFLADDRRQNVGHIRAEVEWMWSSPARFAARGFGAAAVIADSIVCWCTAEYMSEHACGIGIETIPSYQNQGIATITAGHFVQECVRRSIIPHWECDSHNLGSIRVAEKVGFDLIEETTVWAGSFPRQDHRLPMAET